MNKKKDHTKGKKKRLKYDIGSVNMIFILNQENKKKEELLSCVVRVFIDSEDINNIRCLQLKKHNNNKK